MIEEYFDNFIDSLVEYDSVVNQFFLPMIKQKFDEPKEELEKEIKKQNDRLERIRKAYISGAFDLEEYNAEKKIVDDTINKLQEELKENREKIKILIENNDALNIKVKSLEKKVDKQEDEIDELKEENSTLKRTINYFENLFNKLVSFIKKRIFGKEQDRENYMYFSKELYEHGIFSDETIEDIRDYYKFSKEHDNEKEKDDYEIGF